MKPALQQRLQSYITRSQMLVPTVQRWCLRITFHACHPIISDSKSSNVALASRQLCRVSPTGIRSDPFTFPLSLLLSHTILATWIPFSFPRCFGSRSDLTILIQDTDSTFEMIESHSNVPMWCGHPCLET